MLFPGVQPVLSTTSCTRDEISGVLCFSLTVSQAGMLFQETDDEVVVLAEILFCAVVKVDVSSESCARMVTEVETLSTSSVSNSMWAAVMVAPCGIITSVNLNPPS